MILYNTIVGSAAGAGLLGVAQLLKQFANGEKVQPKGFVLTFGTGFIQTVLGLTATQASVRSFARTWTTRLKDRRIRVNAISPGPIDHWA